MQKSNQFSSIKAKLKELSRQQNSTNSDWLLSLKKSLFLMEVLKIPNKHKSVLETKLIPINEALILSDRFDSIKADIFKLLLNIFMSQLQVSIQEFNLIYSSCANSSNSSDFFLLLSESIFFKIEKTFNKDLSDKRLKDYLCDVFKIFGFKDLNFLISVINHELDEERPPDTPAVKLIKVIKMIFGSSKNYRFYLKGSTYLSKLYTLVQNEDLEPINQDLNSLNVRVSYLSNNLTKVWNICRFGLDCENSRFDKIVTIGANQNSDICVEGIQNLASGIFHLDNKLFIANFNDNVQYFVDANQSFFIENGAKVCFAEKAYFEFVDLNSFSVKFNDNIVNFEEKVEERWIDRKLKFVMDEMEVEVKVLEMSEKFILWCPQKSFLYEHGGGEYKPIFLTYLNQENKEIEFDKSQILIDNIKLEFERI